MSRRVGRALPAVALLFLACGCVEVQKDIILNPDGRGKVTIDLVEPASSGTVGVGDQAQEKTLDQMKQEALAKFLMHKGMTAWKDVSAEWLPDGRLHLKGTAYFENLEAIGGSEFEESYHLAKEPDGVLKISIQTGKKDDKKKPVPDFAKMSDKEFDEAILKQRANWQGAKPFMLAIFTDLKMKTVLHLPGQVRELKGFKKDSDQGVTWSLDGNAVLKYFRDYMAQDNATLKKRLKEAGASVDPEMLMPPPEGLGDVHVVVHKLGVPQFDYDKEVKEAHAAYPALRQKLHLDTKVKLPGEETKPSNP